MAQDTSAYNFSLFEPYDYGTSAPKLDPDYIPETSKPVKKKSHQAVKNAEIRATRASAVKTLKALVIVFCLFAVISVAMYLNVKLDETDRKISAVQSEIKELKSDYIKLDSALQSKITVGKVQDYAENVLGMIPLENYKITYFESEDNNHVVISGGKSYSDNDFRAKLGR